MRYDCTSIRKMDNIRGSSSGVAGVVVIPGFSFWGKGLVVCGIAIPTYSTLVVYSRIKLILDKAL